MFIFLLIFYRLFKLNIGIITILLQNKTLSKNIDYFAKNILNLIYFYWNSNTFMIQFT